ncbi:MAG: cytochrome d ubiquinol oxidase subunit II [Acidimicrobiales bacterium]
MSTVVAVVLFAAVIAYSVFGGADFGAGFWDLFAGGPEHGERPRHVIDRSIGPVWEANHVWLIVCFVVLWTAVPEAYGMIWSTVSIPLWIAAFGIVLRGAGFAFRHGVTDVRHRRRYGAAFALSSVIVPFCLGAFAGAIASERVTGDGTSDPWGVWLNPTSIMGGVLAVAVVAFLAATFLVWDAARVADDEMVEYFRRRALGSAIAAGAVALVGIGVLHADSPWLFDRLTGRALPVVALSAACGIACIVLLVRERHGGARLLAVGAVASVVAAWGVAQYDWIVPNVLTIEEAAAPSGTLAALGVAVVLLALFVGPAFVLLYALDQGDQLPAEGDEDVELA